MLGILCRPHRAPPPHTHKHTRHRQCARKLWSCQQPPTLQHNSVMLPQKLYYLIFIQKYFELGSCWDYALTSPESDLHKWLLGGVPDALPCLCRLGCGQPEGPHRWFGKGHSQVRVDHCRLPPHPQVLPSQGSQLGVDQWAWNRTGNTRISGV